MDQRIIESKLESLRRCIKRIENKKPSEPDELEDNYDLQDIISVNLERAVQQCVDIGAHIIAPLENGAPTSMAETFIILSEMEILSKETAKIMKKAVGFRNIAVHNYKSIDWTIVYNICDNQLDDFRRFAKEINKHISN